MSKLRCSTTKPSPPISASGRAGGGCAFEREPRTLECAALELCAFSRAAKVRRKLYPSTFVDVVEVVVLERERELHSLRWLHVRAEADEFGTRRFRQTAPTSRRKPEGAHRRCGTRLDFPQRRSERVSRPGSVPSGVGDRRTDCRAEDAGRTALPPAISPGRDDASRRAVCRDDLHLFDISLVSRELADLVEWKHCRGGVGKGVIVGDLGDRIVDRKPSKCSSSSASSAIARPLFANISPRNSEPSRGAVDVTNNLVPHRDRRPDDEESADARTRLGGLPVPGPFGTPLVVPSPPNPLETSPPLIDETPRWRGFLVVELSRAQSKTTLRAARPSPAWVGRLPEADADETCPTKHQTINTF